MKKVYFDWDEFSGRIKDNLEYGDSMRKISKEIGISPATFSRAFNGKIVDLDTAIQIANWMDIHIYGFIKHN